MWIADNWKDYEVIDTSSGEKLERWGDYMLVRPDPQVIWNTERKHFGWKKPNGHYHRSGLEYVDNVARLDVNSASFNWVPKPHHLFPDEWYPLYECVGNQSIYKDPISAVITMDTEAGIIEVEGTKSSFVCGVSTEESGNTSGYRLCTPDMISATIHI